MIIFNITTIIEESNSKEFHQFMHNIYVPAALSSKKFSDVKLFKLTEPINEGVTYCVQCFANSKEEIELFRTNDFLNIQDIMMQQFPNKVVFFSSILELSKA